jgi:hypothetical protein
MNFKQILTAIAALLTVADPKSTPASAGLRKLEDTGGVQPSNFTGLSMPVTNSSLPEQSPVNTIVEASGTTAVLEELSARLNNIVDQFASLKEARAVGPLNRRELAEMQQKRRSLLEETARLLDEVISVCRDADFLQDVSGSQIKLVEAIKNAMTTIVTEMFEESPAGAPEIGIFTFSVTGETKIGRSTNLSQLTQVISGITYRGGGTRLSTGLQQMLAEMIKSGGVPAGEVRVEAILSDFKVEAADRPAVLATLNQIREAAKPGQVVFMPFGIDAGYGIDRPFMNQIATNQADIREYPNVSAFIAALFDVVKLICGAPPVVVTFSPTLAPTFAPTKGDPPGNPAIPAALATAAFGLAWCCCRRKKKEENEETATPPSEVVSVVDPEDPPAAANPIFVAETFVAKKPNVLREQPTEAHEGAGMITNQPRQDMGFFTGGGNYNAPKGKQRQFGDLDGKFSPGAEEEKQPEPPVVPPRVPTPEPSEVDDDPYKNTQYKIGPFSMITHRLAERENKGPVLKGVQRGLEWAEVPVPAIVARPIDKHIVAPVNKHVVGPVLDAGRGAAAVVKGKISKMKSGNPPEDGNPTRRGPGASQ